ncbi:chitinase [Mycotypha africana]|uniref:chitinase n=1 Tax=Mycotypha africana TaxID=64632 RepID=UPI0023006181|nr:chitinase [Mycotypha africana]KAI8969124.1 chitinase [Mycotypha africana]
MSASAPATEQQFTNDNPAPAADSNNNQIPFNGPATNGSIIAGYFANWKIYERKYNVTDLALQAEKLTHILYAFAKIEENGQVVLSDAWADVEQPLPADLAINGVDDVADQGENVHGNFKQLYLLKQKYRHLKISLSVGGASWSTNFAAIAADPAKRQTFVQSAVKLVADVGLDGLDIDWEFPNDDNEAASYVQLLAEARAALDAYQQQCQQVDQPRFLLSVAVPCGPDNYRKLRLSEMQQYVDIFYLMAYDYAGSWDNVCGHQAACYNCPLNTNQAVNDYLAAGVPSQKLVVGLPMYGRGFSNTDGPQCAYQGVPQGTWEAGLFDYNCLPKPGATEYTDMEKLASWSYDPNLREFITYDTPEVISAKCNYIKQNNLGGAMFWELSADRHPEDPRNLVNAVYNVLGDQTDTVSNHLQYPYSRYENVRSQMA